MKRMNRLVVTVALLLALLLSCDSCGKEAPCPHEFTEPTCSAPSYCRLCGEIGEPALDHAFTPDGETAPTCEEEGVRCFTCSLCGAKRYESIPAIGHTLIESSRSVDGEVVPSDICKVCHRWFDHPTQSEATVGVTVLNEEGKTYDITAAAVRTFMALASTYDTSDYSYTFQKESAAAVSAAALPVSLKWQYASGLSVRSAVLLYSESPDLENALMKDVGPAKSYDLYNLKTGATYYWMILATQTDGTTVSSGVSSFSTLPGVRKMRIPNVNNARDFGGFETVDGKTVKEGLVYRTANLDSLTAASRTVLLDDLGIRTELDLRASGGVDDALGLGEGYHRIGSSQYESYFSASRTGDIMRVFADPDNYPILFHCAGGADRTGSLAIMLKLLLGVSENDAVADFELTNNRHRVMLESDAYTCHEMMLSLHALPGDTVQEKAYRVYREQQGLSLMELSNIYAILMTDGAVYRKTALAKQTVGASGTLSLPVDLRESGGVGSVSVGDSAVPFVFDRDLGTLSFTVSGTAGNYEGSILFADGNSLAFEFAVAP